MDFFLNHSWDMAESFATTLSDWIWLGSGYGAERRKKWKSRCRRIWSCIGIMVIDEGCLRKMKPFLDGEWWRWRLSGCFFFSFPLFLSYPGERRILFVLGLITLYPNAWSWFLAHKVWTFWSDVYAMWIFKSFFFFYWWRICQLPDQLG